MTDTNAGPADKTELLARMRAGRAEWDALIARVPQEDFARPTLPGGWSVKDLVAHVMAYERWTATQVRAAAEGREPTPMELYGLSEAPPDDAEWDLDRQNAAIYAQHRDRPADEVRSLAQQAFADLVAAIEALPAETLATPGAQAWTGERSLLDLLPEQCYAHYGQHLADLQAEIA